MAHKKLSTEITEDIKNQYSPLLKDFKPIEVLGKGGYGSVLMVEFPNKHRAALKVFNNTFDSNKDVEKLNKIKKEITIAKNVKSEYFIKTFYSLQPKVNNKQYFGIIMEIAWYKTLNTFIKKFNDKEFTYINNEDKFFWLSNISETTMKFFTRQIIFAFEFMKRNKMIHLDFKPENILISLYFKIKITDFSLTQIIHDEKEINLTNATTCYMGKEYYQKSKKVKIENAYKIDYFGLGCILYSMIFKEYLIDPPKDKKYDEIDINKFISKGIEKLNNCKRISKELRELVINLINDIEKRKNVEELLKDEWVFPKKKIIKISKKNKQNKKIIDNDINEHNLNNLKTNNSNNKNYIEKEYFYNEIKEQKKIEDINQQDPIKMFIEFNKYAHIKDIKTNVLYYKHKKKFRFKKL